MFSFETCLETWCKKMCLEKCLISKHTFNSVVLLSIWAILKCSRLVNILELVDSGTTVLSNTGTF